MVQYKTIQALSTNAVINCDTVSRIVESFQETCRSTLPSGSMWSFVPSHSLITK